MPARTVVSVMHAVLALFIACAADAGAPTTPAQVDAFALEDKFPGEGVGSSIGLVVGGVPGFYAGVFTIVGLGYLFGPAPLEVLLLGAGIYTATIVVFSGAGAAIGGAVVDADSHGFVAGAAGAAASAATSVVGFVIGDLVGLVVVPNPPGTPVTVRTSAQQGYGIVGFMIGGLAGVAIGGVTTQMVANSLE